MEELIAVFLEVVTEEDVLVESELVWVSESLLSDVAFDMAVLEDVYAGIVRSLEVFKGWMKATFALSGEVVNAMLALQLVHDMVKSHYRSASESGRCISVEEALLDIEGTLIANHAKTVALARKEIASPRFGELPRDVQQKVRSVASQTPRAFWDASKIEIMKALVKIPIYR